MIRRAIAVLVLTASLVVGVPSAANAGELCVNPWGLLKGRGLCLNTNPKL